MRASLALAPMVSASVSTRDVEFVVVRVVAALARQFLRFPPQVLRFLDETLFSGEVGAEFLERREVDGDNGELRFEGGDDDHFAENPGCVNGFVRLRSQFEEWNEAEGGDDDGDAAEGEDAEDGDLFAEADLAVPEHGDGEKEDVHV